MTLQEELMNHVPEYYPYMWLDDYTPDEIMYAARKKMVREHQERMQGQQENEVEKKLSKVVEKTLDELLDGLNR